MNNIKVQYPVAGSSALQAKRVKKDTSHRIIAFPGTLNETKVASVEVKPSARAVAVDRFIQSEAFTELRFGSIEGVPFNRMKKGQSFALGLVSIAAALATIFVGM
ncbi:MAG: hypothetical protein RR241_00950 [Raoultibacter sp.]